MKKTFTLFTLLLVALVLNATTYTRVGAKPASWPGTYILVYEKSGTEAYVWNCEGGSGNYVEVALANGKITSNNIDQYQVTINQESSNNYGLRTANGFVYTEAGKNSLGVDKPSAQGCQIQMNGSYADITTNNGTQKLLFNTSNDRFRFYYDNSKQFTGKGEHIYLYAVGDHEVVESGNALDINYAQADFFACDSKFSPVSAQYYSVNLFLGQEESEDAVPQVVLTMLAYTQYSIAGTYKSSDYYQDGKAGFIHETGGSNFSYIVFPSKEGGTQGSIRECVMQVTTVGASQHINAYKYHFKLSLTDSNNKVWTLDKDLDVYATWTDCDRSGGTPQDMDYVPFTLESGNHNDATALMQNMIPERARKIIQDGRLMIQREDRVYDVMGVQY